MAYLRLGQNIVFLAGFKCVAEARNLLCTLSKLSPEAAARALKVAETPDTGLDPYGMSGHLFAPVRRTFVITGFLQPVNRIVIHQTKLQIYRISSCCKQIELSS